MGFQDFLIEKIFHRSGSIKTTTSVLDTSQTPKAPPESPVTMEPQAPAKNDLLASVMPVAPVFDPTHPNHFESREVTPPEPATIPDWLKGTTDRLTEEVPVRQLEESNDISEPAALPDWLAPQKTSETPVPVHEVPSDNFALPTSSESADTASLPSWLSGSAATAETIE